MSSLVEAHRLAQLKVGAQTIQRMADVWPLLDPENLDATFPRWFRTVEPIVQEQRRVSSAIAKRFYLDLRAEAGIVERFTVPAVAKVEARQLATSMLVTGPAQMRSAVARGVPLVEAASTAEGTSSAAGMRHSLNGGRDTLITATGADSRSRGWRRVASGSACKFCTMLAGRGAVYSKETVDFHAHDGCSCSVAPRF